MNHQLLLKDRLILNVLDFLVVLSLVLIFVNYILVYRIDINLPMIMAYNRDNLQLILEENMLYMINLNVTYELIEQITTNKIYEKNILSKENYFTVNRPSTSKLIIPNKFKLQKQKENN